LPVLLQVPACQLADVLPPPEAEKNKPVQVAPKQRRKRQPRKFQLSSQPAAVAEAAVNSAGCTTEFNRQPDVKSNSIRLPFLLFNYLLDHAEQKKGTV